MGKERGNKIKKMSERFFNLSYDDLSWEQKEFIENEIDKEISGDI